MIIPEDMATIYLSRVNKILGVDFVSSESKEICISLIKLLQNEVPPRRAKYYTKVIKSIEARK